MAVGALARMAELVTLSPSVGRLGLDGLVSVWQPPEN
jgi:hypothetical protein